MSLWTGMVESVNVQTVGRKLGPGALPGFEILEELLGGMGTSWKPASHANDGDGLLGLVVRGIHPVCGLVKNAISGVRWCR